MSSTKRSTAVSRIIIALSVAFFPVVYRNCWIGWLKWGGPVFAWDRITEVTRMAFREMWCGRPGPVQLEVPGPVLYEERDETFSCYVRRTKSKRFLTIFCRQTLATEMRFLLATGHHAKAAEKKASMAAVYEAHGLVLPADHGGWD